jgi:hypothetical protein
VSRQAACPLEADVLELVAIDQWPARADQALRVHVAACASCTELAGVATAIAELRDCGEPARVPDAALVWHEAQRRAREDAARRAARPLLLAQAAGAAAIVLLVALWWSGLSGWIVAASGSTWAWMAGQLETARAAAPAGQDLRRLVTPDAAVWRWVLGVLAAAAIALSIAVGLSRLADGHEEPPSPRVPRF